ncbi:MAG TPA: non-heme iron oxygenase ferredoxin subunit [Acidimicrobiales bacterium]|nr:non-heme iron oxygenase ferredoxin subunit [Acidimicrobiales bacterium]|tara:strand:+ start:2360 stop:2668 length:309 start_codon:yes stop_codon:yes gene_type:complete
MTIVCRSDDLMHGEAQRFDVEGHRIAVVRIGDNVHAVADRCSHANYSLSEGVVWTDECAIECPKHFSKFNLRTGTPDVFPATQPITVYEARVLDGEVIVDLP